MGRVQTSYHGDRVGLFAIDGGLTTGVAYGAVTLDGSTKEIFERDPLTVEQHEVFDRNYMGHDAMAWAAGCVDLCATYQECVAEWILNGIGYDKHFFIFEDFVLYGQVGSTQRSGLAPLWVNAFCQGFLADYTTNWIPQMAGIAKQRWTNDRLKRAGIYTVGMPHGRDATRHAALFVSQNLS